MSEWRYLDHGTVVHALSRITATSTLSHVALCGTAPSWFREWLGAGNQAEYEHAASLRKCRRCLERGAR